MPRISPRSLTSAIGVSVFLFIIFFIINHRSDDLEPIPVKCDCPTIPATTTNKLPTIKTEVPTPPKVEAIVVPKTVTSTVTTTLPPFPPCKQVDTNSSVQRAIIIYYPYHQSEYFFPEVRWYV
jgi:hypothetical protein